MAYTQNKAIIFAEWINNNQFTCFNNEWTSTKIHYSGCVYDTEELYSLFEASAGKNEIESTQPHLPLGDVSGRSEQVCPVCKGTGWVESKIHSDADERCPYCKGQTCH